MGPSYCGLNSCELFIAPVSVSVIVSMLAFVEIPTAVVVVSITVRIAVVAVILVLAVMVAIVVVAFFAEFVAVEFMLPPTVSAPVGTLAANRERTVIAEPRIVVGVDVTVKALGPAEPWAGTEEHASAKPLRPVIAERRTRIRGVVVIAVRTNRGHANADADLCLRPRAGCNHAQASNQWRDEKPGQSHKFLLVGRMLGQSTGLRPVLNA